MIYGEKLINKIKLIEKWRMFLERGETLKYVGVRVSLVGAGNGGSADWGSEFREGGRGQVGGGGGGGGVGGGAVAKQNSQKGAIRWKRLAYHY